MDYIKFLHDTLLKLPAAPPQLCFRVLVDSPGVTDIAAFGERYVEGQAVPREDWRSFVSCSKAQAEEQIKQMCLGRNPKVGCVFFKMNVKSGRDIKALSLFPTEEELLLLPSRPFKVAQAPQLLPRRFLPNGITGLVIVLEEVSMEEGVCCDRTGRHPTLQPCEFCINGESQAFGDKQEEFNRAQRGATFKECKHGKGTCL